MPEFLSGRDPGDEGPAPRDPPLISASDEPRSEDRAFELGPMSEMARDGGALGRGLAVLRHAAEHDPSGGTAIYGEEARALLALLAARPAPERDTNVTGHKFSGLTLTSEEGASVMHFCLRDDTVELRAPNGPWYRIDQATGQIYQMGGPALEREREPEGWVVLASWNEHASKVRTEIVTRGQLHPTREDAEEEARECHRSHPSTEFRVEPVGSRPSPERPKPVPESERLRLLERIAVEAQCVIYTLAQHGPEIVPHLLDTDDNAGERLRELLRELVALTAPERPVDPYEAPR